MLTFFKKTLSVFLVTSLFATQMLQADFWSSMDNVRDGTGVIHETGANGEKLLGLGGSLSVKRESNTYAVWFSYQSPSISASCSGFSFKGMFGSIIDMDELSEQFSEAGESLAWGVLVGIIYSLPGIGEIFQKLNDWAKKIQALLANACQTSTAITKGLLKKPMAQTLSTADGWFTSKVSYIKNETVDIAKKVGEYFDVNSDACKYLSVGDCASAKKDTMSSIMNGYKFDSGIGSVLANNFDNGAGSWATAESTQDATAAYLKWDIAISDTNLKKDLAFYALINTTKSDARIASNVAKTIHSSITSLLDESLPAKDKERAYKYGNDYFEAQGITQSKPKFDTNTELIKYLVNGAIDTNDTANPRASYTEFKKKITLPKVLYTVYEDVANKSGAVIIMPILDEVDASTTGIFEFLDSYQGINALAEDTATCHLSNLENNSTECTNSTNSFIDTNVFKKYQKIYNHSSIEDKNLIRINYVEFLKALIANMIQATVEKHVNNFSKQKTTFSGGATPTNDSPVSAPVTDKKIEIEIERNKKALLKELNEKLSKTFVVYDYKNMVETFNIINNRNNIKVYLGGGQ